MNVSKRVFLSWWLGGLAAFAIVLYLHGPLVIPSVPDGISAHQRAPDGATVDAIQHAWREAGLVETARIAMIGDFVFIGVFGLGCMLAGIHYRAKKGILLRGLGWLALIGGGVFVIADYAETIAQFLQLSQFSGDDLLAALASGFRPIKVASWIAGFMAVASALIVEGFLPQRA
ncbi:MAG: hypothetical protein AAF707_08260 [Pseudomonadota bacterium]